MQDKRGQQGRSSEAEEAGEAERPPPGSPWPDAGDKRRSGDAAPVAASAAVVHEDAHAVVAVLARARDRVAGIAQRLGRSHSSLATVLEEQPHAVIQAKAPEMQVGPRC
jgi:hypothetical protein